MVAAIGNGAAFAKGRDFGAWLGLVPRQISAGGRTILGKISKRTIATVRVLFVQAARARSEREYSCPLISSAYCIEEQMSSSACAAKWGSVAPEASERHARRAPGFAGS